MGHETNSNTSHQINVTSMKSYLNVAYYEPYKCNHQTIWWSNERVLD